MILLPARMGMLNRRALIRQMEKAGLASRADLARSLGMSQPTAGKIVDELLRENILEEITPTADSSASLAGPGRPGRLLCLNRSRPGFLGIQMGVSHSDFYELPLNASCPPLWQECLTHPGKGANPVRAWEQSLKRMAARSRRRKFHCAVLSVPGVVDEPAGRVIFSPNIHWSEKADLPGIIQRHWKIPVFLVQEERTLALGHHRQHPEHEDFLLVDFGDGVGGAILTGGKPFASSQPIGELGHTPVPGNRRKCGCGATGCLETLVSVHGLLRSFAEEHPAKRHGWTELQSHIVTRGVEPWLGRALQAAAVVIAGALNVLGLRRVVLTGALNELSPKVVARLADGIREGSIWARFGAVDCHVEARNRMAGLVAVGIDRFIAPEPMLKQSFTAKN